jgi:hypothetical protein
MGAVEAYAEFALDDGRDSTRGPEIRLEPPGLGAPWSKTWDSLPRCCLDNFGGRPAAGFARSAAGPRRRTASRQRMTELCEHASRRATSVMEVPVQGWRTTRNALESVVAGS